MIYEKGRNNNVTKIAIMGFGTIGSGVAEVIEKNASRLKKTCGDDIELKYVLDVRDFEGTPIEKKIVHYEVKVEDDDIILVTDDNLGMIYSFKDYTKEEVSEKVLAKLSTETNKDEKVLINGLKTTKKVDYLYIKQQLISEQKHLRAAMYCHDNDTFTFSELKKVENYYYGRTINNKCNESDIVILGY